MSNYEEEIDYLSKTGRLPHSDYIPLVRFTTGYENSIEAAIGAAFFVLYPAVNATVETVSIISRLATTAVAGRAPHNNDSVDDAELLLFDHEFLI